MKIDWTKVKSAIAVIAPWLAGTLGSPVAGVAVHALCEVFGLSPELTKPEDLAAKVLTATPDQLQALKDRDATHAEFMAKIGYSTIESLEALAVQDREAARQMQIAQPSRFPAVLCFTLTAAVLGILAARMAGFPLPDDSATNQLVGAVVTLWTASGMYWFGTTRNSANKDILLAQSTPAGQ